MSGKRKRDDDEDEGVKSGEESSSSESEDEGKKATGEDGKEESSSDSSDGDDSSDSDDEDGLEITLKFRNYNPLLEELKKYMLPRLSVSAELSWLDAELKRITESKFKLDDAVLNIAPKKANWDLKRDAKPKIDILNLMTQRAVLELIKVKVEQQQAEESSSDSDSSGSDSDEEEGGKEK
eukprot:gb/GEZN01011376.1/.p1 GENE.gb/GEZN01011376.1/~~gb/GEZN01011376.1/.p1  ORF type:complete len:180 (-),score=57.82 gb/GEZN01011376.1/:584-1123(-)